jgi:hypothetical protein
MSDIVKAPLVWDADGERLYETGVEKGVLYLKDGGKYANGVAWNGLSKVSESPSGAEPTALYANNKKYLELMSNEEFAATIEAYMYPDEFAECDGSAELAPGVRITQQNRKTFGLSYKTLIGNDEVGTDYGYKLHLVYGCLAKPSSRENSTVNDSPEAVTMSWEASTTPVAVSYGGKDYKPTAHLTIDSKKVDSDKLKKLEEALYGHYESLSEEPSDWSTKYNEYFTKGDDGKYTAVPKSGSQNPTFTAGSTYKFVSAYLPLPDEVAKIFATA